MKVSISRNDIRKKFGIPAEFEIEIIGNRAVKKSRKKEPKAKPEQHENKTT